MEQELLKKLKLYMKQEELKRVKEAYDLANYLHRDALRDSGEPYIIHPLSVASILSDRYADVDTICASLLHDTIEDTDMTKELLQETFGETTAQLVDGVSKLKGRNLHEKQILKYANMRKLMIGFTVDPRIILIKTADRLHNMRTIDYKKEKKKIENSLETLNTYVPMTNLVGASVYLNELASRSFKVVSKEEYEQIEKERKKTRIISEEEIQKTATRIQELLEKYQIKNQMNYRIKNNYQLFQNLRKGKKIEEVNDLIAIKITVEDILDCYKVLDIINSYFEIEASQEKDYIAKPKDNLYQSLHTTIKNSLHNIQIQIKTPKMEKLADYGLAAYWEFYKRNAREQMEKDLKNKMFYKTLTDLGDFYEDNKEFVEQVQIELFGDKVYVYTPMGKMVALPIGSTPIDFANSIHTELLKNMVGARVNGSFVPVNYRLQNKDKVMIITGEEGKSKNWEEFATTTSAKRTIRKMKN